MEYFSPNKNHADDRTTTKHHYGLLSWLEPWEIPKNACKAKYIAAIVPVASH